jgi:hypothetical protein
MNAGLEILGIILVLLGAFGIVFEAFCVSALWGMISLLVPIGPSLFAMLHFRLVRKPFFVHVLGIAFIAAASWMRSD